MANETITAVTVNGNIAVGNDAFYGCKNLASVTFGENGGFTSIGTYAFLGCEALTSLTIKGNISQIGYKAFSDCKSLTDITFTGGVGEIGENAFTFCNSLKSVDLSAGIASIGTYAFNSCSALTTVKLPASGKVTFADNAFYYADKLSEITLCDAELGSMAFYKCTSLEKVTINGSVSVGNNAFYGCTALKGIDFGTTGKITSLGDGAFSDCSSLTSISLSGLTNIGSGAFYACTSLSEAILDGSVTEMGDSVFSDCTALTSVTLPSSLTAVNDYTFSYCSSLEQITLPTGLTAIGNSAFAGSKLSSLTLPSTVTTIDEYAFARTELTSISIPKATTSIGSGFTGGCTKLATLTVDEDNSGYKCVDNVLFSKDGKTLILYAPAKTDESYTIPEGVTELSPFSFGDCTGLKKLTLPASLAHTQGMLFEALLSALTYMDSGEYYNDSIAEIAVAENNTDLKAEDGVLFTKDGKTLVLCPPKKITDSYSVPAGVTKIDYGAFFNTGIKNIVLPKGLTEIGSYAFTGNTLEHIYLPKSITAVGDYAFAGLTGLKKVTYEGNLQEYMRFVQGLSSGNIAVLANTGYDCEGGNVYAESKYMNITEDITDEDTPAGKCFMTYYIGADFDAGDRLMLALYDGDILAGVLICDSLDEPTDGIGGPADDYYAWIVPGITTEYTSAKLMIWNMNTLKPLCEPIIPQLYE